MISFLPAVSRIWGGEQCCDQPGSCARTPYFPMRHLADTVMSHAARNVGSSTEARSLMWICGRVRDERSMVVGDQGALGSGADLPVEPDGSVEGEQALEDTGPQPRGDAAAMAVQAELVLQRPDDRLHPLAQPGGEAAW